MEQDTKLPVEHEPARPAAERDGEPVLANDFQDHRPVAAAQRRLSDAVGSSPRIAQLARQQSLMGSGTLDATEADGATTVLVTRRSAPASPPPGAPIQRQVAAAPAEPEALAAPAEPEAAAEAGEQMEAEDVSAATAALTDEQVQKTIADADPKAVQSALTSADSATMAAAEELAGKGSVRSAVTARVGDAKEPQKVDAAGAHEEVQEQAAEQEQEAEGGSAEDELLAHVSEAADKAKDQAPVEPVQGRWDGAALPAQLVIQLGVTDWFKKKKAGSAQVEKAGAAVKAGGKDAAITLDKTAALTGTIAKDAGKEVSGTLKGAWAAGAKERQNAIDAEQAHLAKYGERNASYSGNHHLAGLEVGKGLVSAGASAGGGLLAGGLVAGGGLALGGMEAGAGLIEGGARAGYGIAASGVQAGKDLTVAGGKAGLGIATAGGKAGLAIAKGGGKAALAIGGAGLKAGGKIAGAGIEAGGAVLKGGVKFAKGAVGVGKSIHEGAWAIDQQLSQSGSADWAAAGQDFGATNADGTRKGIGKRIATGARGVYRGAKGLVKKGAGKVVGAGGTAAGLLTAGVGGAAGLAGGLVGGGALAAGGLALGAVPAALGGAAALGTAGLGAGVGLGVAGLGGAAGLTTAGAGLGAGLTTGAAGIGAGATTAGLGLGAGLTTGALGIGAGATTAALGGAAGLVAATGGLAAGGLAALGGGVAAGGNAVLEGGRRGIAATTSMGKEDPAGLAEASASGMGVPGTLTGAGGTIASLAQGGKDMTSGTYNALGAGAGIAGIAGGAAGLISAGKQMHEMTELSQSHAERGGSGVGALAALSAGAGSTSNAAMGIELARMGKTSADFASSGLSAAASGAATATAGLGIVTGSIDVLRGAAGGYQAHKREKRMDALAKKAAADPNQKDVAAAAKYAAEIAHKRKDLGKRRVGTGALQIVGGAILLAAGLSNPIGWIVLGTAGAIGGVFALKKLYKNYLTKEEVEVSVPDAKAPGGVRKEKKKVSHSKAKELRRAEMAQMLHGQQAAAKADPQGSWAQIFKDIGASMDRVGQLSTKEIDRLLAKR